MLKVLVAEVELNSAEEQVHSFGYQVVPVRRKAQVLAVVVYVKHHESHGNCRVEEPVGGTELHPTLLRGQVGCYQLLDGLLRLHFWLFVDLENICVWKVIVV